MYLGLSPAIAAKQEMEGERHYQAPAASAGFFARLMGWFRQLLNA
jgi:hypothetical protein